MLTEARASTAQLGYWSGQGNIRFMNVCMNSGNLFSTMLCLTERIRVSCEDKRLSYFVVQYLTNALFNSTLPISKTIVRLLDSLNQSDCIFRTAFALHSYPESFKQLKKNNNLIELVIT